MRCNDPFRASCLAPLFPLFRVCFTALIGAGLTLGIMSPLAAQDTRLTNAYGMPGGLIDMPTAEAAPDAEVMLSWSHFAGTSRSTLAFQITPRLTGAFRFSSLKNLGVAGYDIYTDRSFDLSYQVLRETDLRPAVAIGLRDFIGTGLYGAEYIVATKGFAGDRLRVSGGIGWGRLGSSGAFADMGHRPATILGTGGIPTYDRWFRGPVAAFAGVSLRATDQLTLRAEYSSDGYTTETTAPADVFTRRSNWNLGFDYALRPNLSLAAHWLHGSELGVSLRYGLNPVTTPRPMRETAPLPVLHRAARSLGWDVPDNGPARLAQLNSLLDHDGISATEYRRDGPAVIVVLRNDRYDIAAQAIGRMARALTRIAPPDVTRLEIVTTHQGMPVSRVTLNRDDIEDLEHAPARAIWARAQIRDAEGIGMVARRPHFPSSDWHIGPYVTFGLFDPRHPIRAEAGIRASGRVRFAPGWVASGSVSARGLGRVGGVPRASTVTPVNPPPVVRTDAGLYAPGRRPKIDHLTLTHYGRPAPNLYSRLTLGYLEPMYAGFSAELMWKPVDRRLALGVEVNHVIKRGYDQLFDLGEYRVTTGHFSAYYDFGNGFHGQLDVGRYLAGDIGATATLTREFANGWRIGAFVTKTNLSARSFGEGSFDKGIRVTIPMSWITGKPGQGKSEQVIHSLTRDGGARLHVDGRLYSSVRGLHSAEMAKSWGKFWK